MVQAPYLDEWGLACGDVCHCKSWIAEIVQYLYAAKSGLSDVELTWGDVAGATGFNLYLVESDSAGTGKDLIPMANGIGSRIEPRIQPVPSCTMVPVLSCRHVGAIETSILLYYYQIVAACATTEGPN